LNHPLLKKLRIKYKLEDIVNGYKTQFEKVLALAHWVANQWKWHPPVKYPPWNALEILKKQKDGKPLGGFCGHFAIVFMQCCLSLGIQARYTFSSFPGIAGGHEVVEVWSDEYSKWIIIDPNLNRYYRDRKSNIPLNAIELHRCLLNFYFKNSKIKDEKHNRSKYRNKSFSRYLKEGPKVCVIGRASFPNWFRPDRSHLMWGYPRLMPRTNFLSSPYPIPKCHGYRMEWSWNGYLLWEDEKTPRNELHFSNFVERECDWYPTLNQVHFVISTTNKKDTLRVYLDTFTPDLKDFLVNVDYNGWKVSKNEFLWKLHNGSNLLRVKVKNKRGIEGKESLIKIKYKKEVV